MSDECGGPDRQHAGDVPMIRELYPETLWTWHTFAGRKQTNEEAAEVLLVKRTPDSPDENRSTKCESSHGIQASA